MDRDHKGDVPIERIEFRLCQLYGEEISIENLKTALAYASIEAVIMSIREGRLTLAVNGVFPMKERVVKVGDLAAYIADQRLRVSKKTNNWR